MTDRELLAFALEEMSFRVAYVYEHEGEESGDDYSNVCDAIRARLAQPEQKPLTDEEWLKWWQVSSVMDNTQAEIDFADFILIARAIEAAHGIKEKT